MNALKAHQKNQAEKEHEEFLKKMEEERIAYEKMTPEEKIEYKKRKAARDRQVQQILGLALSICSTGDYGTQIFDSFRDLD